MTTLSLAGKLLAWSDPRLLRFRADPGGFQPQHTGKCGILGTIHLNAGRPDDGAGALFVIPAKAGIQCLFSELKAFIRHSREGGNPVNRVHRASEEVLSISVMMPELSNQEGIRFNFIDDPMFIVNTPRPVA